MSSPLHLDVFVVPYKPIVGLIPPMGEGEATWPATSVSLISGERDAVLIDATLTPEDAQAKIVVAATNAQTHAMTIRTPFSPTPRPISATSTNLFPRAVRPRSWSTR